MICDQESTLTPKPACSSNNLSSAPYPPHESAPCTPHVALSVQRLANPLVTHSRTTAANTTSQPAWCSNRPFRGPARDSESAMYAPCVPGATTMALQSTRRTTLPPESAFLISGRERALLHLSSSVPDSYVQTSRQTATHPPKLQRRKECKGIDNLPVTIQPTTVAPPLSVEPRGLGCNRRLLPNLPKQASSLCIRAFSPASRHGCAAVDVHSMNQQPSPPHTHPALGLRGHPLSR